MYSSNFTARLCLLISLLYCGEYSDSVLGELHYFYYCLYFETFSCPPPYFASEISCAESNPLQFYVTSVVDILLLEGSRAHTN